jgi:hypothetical protein
MKLFRLPLAAVALLLASCIPTIVSPLGTTTEIGADPALRGCWEARAPDGKTVAYYHFIPINRTTITVITVTHSGDKTQKSEWAHYRIGTAALGKHRYMNVVQVGRDDDNNPDVVPILYRFDDERTLALYLPDEDKIKQAIEEKKLAGAVDEKSGDIKITASGPALDDFFAKPDAASYFMPYAILKKLD